MRGEWKWSYGMRASYRCTCGIWSSSTLSTTDLWPRSELCTAHLQDGGVFVPGSSRARSSGCSPSLVGRCGGRAFFPTSAYGIPASSVNLAVDELGGPWCLARLEASGEAYRVIPSRVLGTAGGGARARARALRRSLVRRCNDSTPAGAVLGRACCGGRCGLACGCGLRAGRLRADHGPAGGGAR